MDSMGMPTWLRIALVAGRHGSRHRSGSHRIPLVLSPNDLGRRRRFAGWGSRADHGRHCPGALIFIKAAKPLRPFVLTHRAMERDMLRCGTLLLVLAITIATPG